MRPLRACKSYGQSADRGAGCCAAGARFQSQPAAAAHAPLAACKPCMDLLIEGQAAAQRVHGPSQHLRQRHAALGRGAMQSADRGERVLITGSRAPGTLTLTLTLSLSGLTPRAWNAARRKSRSAPRRRAPNGGFMTTVSARRRAWPPAPARSQRSRSTCARAARPSRRRSRRVAVRVVCRCARSVRSAHGAAR